MNTIIPIIQFCKQYGEKIGYSLLSSIIFAVLTMITWMTFGHIFAIICTLIFVALDATVIGFLFCKWKNEDTDGLYTAV